VSSSILCLTVGSVELDFSQFTLVPRDEDTWDVGHPASAPASLSSIPQALVRFIFNTKYNKNHAVNKTLPTPHDREHAAVWTEVERELASNAVVVNTVEEVTSVVRKCVLFFRCNSPSSL